MKTKINIKHTLSILTVAVIAFSLGHWSDEVNASGTIQSQGKLVYNNPETSEEVVIDTNDLQVLQQLIDENTNLLNETNKDINGLSFDKDSNGNWGYKPSGTNTVIPFKQANTGTGIGPNKVFTHLDFGSTKEINNFKLGEPTTVEGFYISAIFNVSELSNFNINITGKTSTVIAVTDNVVTDIKSGDTIEKADYVMVFYNSASVYNTLSITFNE